MPDPVTVAPAAAVIVPMHGIGGRQDLPLPFELVVAGSAVAVVASFVILGFAWKTARYRDSVGGRALPDQLTRIVDGAAFRWTIRGFGLAVAAYMTMALVFGEDLLINPIFGFIYVWVWVGLVPISLLFGPIWRTLNPLRSLHLLACTVTGQDPSRGLYRLPDGIGLWPAAVGLYAFVWLELVAPDRTTVPILLIWLALYVVIMLCGSVLFGQSWFTAADPFEAYATLMAKLSPWGRDADSGQIALRTPLHNLSTHTPRPGLVLLVAVLLGSTAYDGFSNSTSWIGWAQDSDLPPQLSGTLALTAFIAIVFTTYSAATALSGTLTHVGRNSLPGLFAHSLIPIALGYVTAHYLTLLILEGQRTLIQFSDPLSRGWNVFGTAEWGVNASIISYSALIGVTQAGAVVTGHIVGVVSAHDQSLKLFPRNRAVRGQLPLLAVMVGYTVAGLLLLFTV